MAKTKRSIRGKQQKKIVPVKSYMRGNKRVKSHRKSTPN